MFHSAVGSIHGSSDSAHFDWEVTGPSCGSEIHTYDCSCYIHIHSCIQYTIDTHVYYNSVSLYIYIYVISLYTIKLNIICRMISAVADVVFVRRLPGRSSRPARPCWTRWPSMLLGVDGRGSRSGPGISFWEILGWFEKSWRCKSMWIDVILCKTIYANLCKSM